MSVEAWPFSAYPMFSQPPSTIRVMKLEFLYSSGAKILWQPVPALSKIVDRDLKYALKNEKNAGQLFTAIGWLYHVYSKEHNKGEEIIQVNLVCFERSRSSKTQKILKEFKVTDLSF
jgi:hypothetical protein